MSDIKKAISVLAFDDGYFKPRTKAKVIFVGVVYRLDHRVEGIISDKIMIDAQDVTKKAIKLVNECKFKPQIKYVLFSGINFAGFNVLDVEKFSKKTKLPVIIVFRRKPKMKKFLAALKKLNDADEKLALIVKAGKIYSFKGFYFQMYSLSEKEAKTLLKKTLLHANLPEPVRLAHMIASGVSFGQSTTTQ